MSGLLGSIFGFGDQLKRNLRDAYKDPQGYAENVAHQNNIEWKKNPDERSMGFFNPVPLGSMGNFVLRKKLEDSATNLSRRDFLKKSAGIAGGSAAASIPGSKLLQKFAPEERAAAKEAVAEVAPKYKYNSLKEYLDYVEEYATLKPPEASGKLISPRGLMEERLLQDEKYYKEFKEVSKLKNGGKPISREEASRELARQRMFDQYDPPGVMENAPEDIAQASREWMTREDKWTQNIKKQMDERLDAFSPQAKEEMRLYKGYVNNVNNSAKHDYTHPGYNENALEWSDPSVIRMYFDESVPF